MAAAPRGADPPVYLDNWAATLMQKEAVSALVQWCNGGHPGADRAAAKKARAMLRGFRESLAVEGGFHLSGPGSFEVVFTSGADESNSAIITGAVLSFAAKVGRMPHVVTSEAEPPSVLACCSRLERDRRCLLTVLPVGKAGGDPARLGLVEPGALAAALRRSTCLVSLSPVGGGAGTLADVAELAQVAKARSVPFHTDASALFGLAPVRPAVLGLDAVSLDFGQLHGAPGTGALILRKDLIAGYGLCPIIHGAENGGLRGGAENVPGLGASFAGFQRALGGSVRDAAARVAQLRDALKTALTNHYPSSDLEEFIAAGGPAREGPALVWVAPVSSRRTHPGLLLFAVVGSAAKELCSRLEDRGVLVAAPGGSRAAPASEPPAALKLVPGKLARRLYFGLDPIAALELPPAVASGLIRVSLSRYSTAEDIKAFAQALVLAAPPKKAAPGSRHET